MFARLLAIALALQCAAQQVQSSSDPQELEELICELASSKDIEKHAVEAVCAKIAATFPKIKFDPDCKTMLEGVWDAAVAMCPKPRERALAPPQDVEKLICELASSKDIEEHAVEAVCAKIAALFPTLKFDPDCKTTLEGVWAVAVAKCPKLPSSQDLEKMICEVAYSSKKIEEDAVEAVCTKLAATLLKRIECKAMLEGIWVEAMAKCPKPREQALTSPQELENLICELASSKDMEEHAVEAVCAKIAAMFPKIKFDPDCKTTLEGVWDVAMAMCPKPEATANIFV